MNPMKLVQLKPAMNKFQNRHPKFIQFFNSLAASGLREGSVLEISITDPDGKTMCTNMKVTADDMRLMNDISEAMNG